ncbi:MAG TPA: hypothetical protein VGC56_16380 [Allosphingosinicella sp.]|jgi:hypothetical protein
MAKNAKGASALTKMWLGNARLMGLSGTSVPFEDRPLASIYAGAGARMRRRRLGACESHVIRGLPHARPVLARGKYVTPSRQKDGDFFALFE